MRYRVVSNGYNYKVKYRFKYWPFWFTVAGPLEDIIFVTCTEAENYIVGKIEESARRRAKYKVVKHWEKQ